MTDGIVPLAGTPGLVSGEENVRAAYARRPKNNAHYSWSSPGHVFNQQEKEREVLGILKTAGLMPLERREVLEVGCGTGAWLRMFLQWGVEPARLAGIDLLPGPLSNARRRVPPTVGLYQASAATLPFRSASFDIVLQATVFSSMVNAGLRKNTAAEMLRVLKPGGIVLWYDFFMNNPGNRDVVGIKRREIESLFPGCAIALRRTALAPPLMRRLAGRSWLATYLLGRVPLLCTHYVGTIRKAA